MPTVAVRQRAPMMIESSKKQDKTEDTPLRTNGARSAETAAANTPPAPPLVSAKARCALEIQAPSTSAKYSDDRSNCLGRRIQCSKYDRIDTKMSDV